MSDFHTHKQQRCTVQKSVFIQKHSLIKYEQPITLKYMNKEITKISLLGDTHENNLHIYFYLQIVSILNTVDER